MSHFNYSLLLVGILILGCSPAKSTKKRQKKEQLTETTSTLKKSKSSSYYQERITYLNQQIDSLQEVLSTNTTKLETPLEDTIYTITPDTFNLRQRFINLRIQNQTLKDSIKTIQEHLRVKYAVKDHTAKQVIFNGTSYDAYIVDTRVSNLKFYWLDTNNQPILNLKSLGNLAKSRGETLVFATNAGMYRPNNSPQGLFVENRKTKIPVDRKTEGYGNFYMQPNGIFLIDTNKLAKVITTQDYTEDLASRVEYATQSGPMVVVNDTINSLFNPTSKNVHYRSGVGQIDPYRIVFIISNDQVNLYNFASIFKEIFQCKNALYLDGAISQMYLPGLGRFQDGGRFGPLIGITKN